MQLVRYEQALIPADYLPGLEIPINQALLNLDY
jgi:hypothetical protein